MPCVLKPFLLLLAVACAGPPPSPDWNASLQAAQCTRAEQLLAAGDAKGARQMAQAALDLTAAVADPTAEARARHVLGLIDDDRGQLALAAALLEEAAPGPGLWEIRIGLARASLGAGADENALAQLERLLLETGRWPDIFQRAEMAALAHHLAASIERARGHEAEARTHVRQAHLALTLVAEDVHVPLRAVVAQELGDDLAAQRDFSAAFEAHARATSLYQRVGDSRGELGALRSLGRDLAGLGRMLDAADQAGRALRAAIALADNESASAIAREALAWLDAARAPADDPRRSIFEAALDPRTVSKAATGSQGD